MFPTNQSNQGGFGFGGNAVDLTSSQGLYELAQMQGGSIAQIADELQHPNRGILSTIGNGFKNAFTGFVDIISMPQQIVAGALSSQYTIGEAIDQNINPSDIILGQADPNASTMQKVGGWVVRTAVDVLLDPLTYVTFGVGGAAKVGLKATDDLAKLTGKTVGDKLALSKAGEELYQKGVQAQINGLKATALKTGGIKELEGEALDRFVKETIDSELDTDFVKQSMARMISNNPALVETLLDKGGIKFLGRTLLEGQRISKTLNAIPGWTMADELTQPLRYTMYSLFNNQYTPEGRIPDEVFDTINKWKDIGEAKKSDLLKKLPAIWKNLGINQQEDEFVRAAVEMGKMPSDPKLAEAWAKLKFGDEYTTGMDLSKFGINVRPELDTASQVIQGVNKKNIKELWSAGIKVHEMDNYVGHFLTTGKVNTFPFQLPASYTAKAEKMAGFSKFIPKAGKEGTLGKFEEPLLGSMDNLGLKQDEVTGAITDISGREFERVRATVEEAASKGLMFDPSGISTSIKSSLDAIKASTLKHMIKEIGEKTGVPMSEASDKLVGISIKGLKDERIDFAKFVTSSKGEQLMFHPETAKRLEEFFGAVINDEPTNKLLNAYDKVLNLWKASVTSIFPAFHGRNAISNVFLNYLDIGKEALNPANHVFSANLINTHRKVESLYTDMFKAGEVGMKAKDEYFDAMMKPMFKDATGYDWSYGELIRVIKQNNVAFNQGIVNSADIIKKESTVFDELFPKKGIASTVKKVAGAPFKFGQEVVGGTIENHSRLLNFITNLKKTGDPSLAAARTKQFLFDYGNLTKFEKTFLRRIIPFYTFTRKNIELQVRTLLTTPGKTSQQLTAIRTLGETLSGDNALTEEEKKALPDYITSGTNVLRSKKGSLLSIYGSFGTPIEQPFQAFQPSAILGSVSPLLRVPVEQMSGYSFYNGKALSEVTNAGGYKNAPEAIKKLIGFKEVSWKNPKTGEYTKWYVSLRPEMMNVVNNLPMSGRVISSLKQMQNENVAGQDRIIQQILGTRPYSIDIEREMEKREAENRKQLEQLLLKAGVIAQFKKTFVPKE